MILTTTYRDRTVASRDLLAAYSPLDHATTATLPAEALDSALERLVRRLVALIALHGPQVPACFLDALTAAATGAAPVDVVDLTAAFLERGTAEVTGLPSELQQELVHFSRIVDLGQLGLHTGAAEHALRRLRGSDRLPDALKVLSELIIVARSRLIQRGRALPLPWLRSEGAVESEVADDLTTASPTVSPDYWVVVRCERRRLRRQFRFELSALLEYLTPAEAALALWAHCHEQRLGVAVELAVAQVDATTGTTVVAWRHQPSGTPGRDAFGRVSDTLPAITHLPPDTATTICDHQVRSTGPTSAVVTEAARVAAELSAPAAVAPADPADLATRACERLAAYTGPEVVSMEAGHIHLDRDLDADQDAGVAIGAALLGMLAARQRRPVALTPMMDDDHVLVRLTPESYRRFLRRTFGPVPMHLICESSPIIRAIVVALFQRLRNSRPAGHLQRRGGNLYLPLEDGTHCELFEDIDGAATTGCVFFEAALLIYRSAPKRFDAYFTDRYQLDAGVHEHAAALLSRHDRANAAGGHDTTIAALQDYYRRFADVTNPHRPDRHITALVNDVLAGADPVYAHLNVLEDYYEVQQHRVRALLNLLDLPLRLVTVHFNATTGRLALCDG
ncbi:hypothetical protein DP939_07985 [Spongiactinospora rosea]|uniref:Uncharacterized protein n=1 Tax=Spongiactinospora rosea TaxID=2248750 RepID=A0A366M459_9ACTN|nr:hypothetical protein [Spongiactinospora rosea]RBQ20986.1 hypothetical protein DP939_07985 [Spongiactinospora rosea]